MTSVKVLVDAAEVEAEDELFVSVYVRAEDTTATKIMSNAVLPAPPFFTSGASTDEDFLGEDFLAATLRARGAALESFMTVDFLTAGFLRSGVSSGVMLSPLLLIMGLTKSCNRYFHLNS
jgi:hypothetical protein